MENYSKKAYEILFKNLKKIKEPIYVAFSAGIDSTLILQTLLNLDKKCFGLCMGFSNSKDILMCEKLIYKYPTKIILLDDMKNDLIQEYNYFLNKGFDKLRSNVLSPIRLFAKICKKMNVKKIAFGSGAEELFLGYRRYYNYEFEELNEISKREFDYFLSEKGDLIQIKKIFNEFNIKSLFPFANKNFYQYILKTPISWRKGPIQLKKNGIREIAKIACVDTLILNRNKLALQYSTNTKKEIDKAIRLKKMDKTMILKGKK